MPTTPHLSRNFKLAAIASLPSRLRRIKSKCYAWGITLCLCDTSLSRTKFRAAYLLPIAWTASLVPVFEPGLVRAEINNAGALAPCLLAAVDQTARPRSCEEARPHGAQSAVPAAPSAGTWRLVRTPNPRGGPDAVSIMQTADAARSDIDLAGLTLRCSDTGFDVIVVFLKAFPPRTHPKVELTTGSATVHLEATVIPPGAAISLPADAATMAKGSWQSSLELAIEVKDDGNTTQGVISLVGLGPALSLLTSNCPSR